MKTAKTAFREKLMTVFHAAFFVAAGLVALSAVTLGVFYAPFFGEDGAWGRSFHDGRPDIRQNAVEYGFNFAEQWEYALKVDPEIVFITGWNEWTAGQWRWDRTQPFTYTVKNDEGEFTFVIANSNERDAQANHLFTAFSVNFGFADST